jgi:hypothetical protein
VMLRPRLALSMAACLTALAPAARADVAKCVDANAHSQALRRDGKLAAAHAELLACAAASCPELVRDDCAARLDEVERAQPTILFDARDGDGHDLVAVKVTVDGQPLADRLDGKALRVDPGEHTFVFAAEGQPPVTQRLVLREAEKDRRERVVIGAATVHEAPAPAPVVAPPPAEPAPSGLGTRRILGIALGGAGVVGIGVGAIFGAMASSAWSSAKSACGGDIGRCADVSSGNSYKSTTLTDGAVSTVGFVAGGVLLAGGVVLFLLPQHSEAPAAARLTVGPAIGPSQQGLLVSGSF